MCFCSTSLSSGNQIDGLPLVGCIEDFIRMFLPTSSGVEHSPPSLLSGGPIRAKFEVLTFHVTFTTSFHMVSNFSLEVFGSRIWHCRLSEDLFRFPDIS